MVLLRNINMYFNFTINAKIPKKCTCIINLTAEYLRLQLRLHTTMDSQVHSRSIIISIVYTYRTECKLLDYKKLNFILLFFVA